MKSENIDLLITALAKAQGEMSAASKDCSNPFFNSKYADLSSVWNACREALSRNGIAVVQTMHKDDKDEPFLMTTLGHSSGQWIASTLDIKVRIPETPELNEKGKIRKVNEMQALGSVLTYLRRYALSAIVGVCPDEDDDGNSQSYLTQKQKARELSDGEILGRLIHFGNEAPFMIQWLKHRVATFQTTMIQELDWLLDANFQEKLLNDYKMYKIKNVVNTTT